MTSRGATVGLEEFRDGRIDLWIPLVPGAHARVGAGDHLAQGRATLAAFADWLEQHELPPAAPLELSGVQRFAVRSLDDYEINATFDDDHLPVEPDEFDSVLAWMAASREDLLSAVSDLDDAALSQRPAAGRSIREILDHLADAEAWYASRLDPPGAARTLVDYRRAAAPLERLAGVRNDALSVLRHGFSELARARTEPAGETWTLRKVLRRYLWHERWHTAQIESLARRLAASAWFEGQGPDEGPAGRPRDGDG